MIRATDRREEFKFYVCWPKVTTATTKVRKAFRYSVEIKTTFCSLEIRLTDQQMASWFWQLLFGEEVKTCSTRSEYLLAKRRKKNFKANSKRDGGGEGERFRGTERTNENIFILLRSQRKKRKKFQTSTCVLSGISNLRADKVRMKGKWKIIGMRISLSDF